MTPGTDYEPSRVKSDYRVEVFYPPYYYMTADKPRILSTSSDRLDYLGALTIRYGFPAPSNGSSPDRRITRAVLVAPSSCTHSFNTNQRLVGLEIVQVRSLPCAAGWHGVGGGVGIVRREPCRALCPQGCGSYPWYRGTAPAAPLSHAGVQPSYVQKPCVLPRLLLLPGHHARQLLLLLLEPCPTLPTSPAGQPGGWHSGGPRPSQRLRGYTPGLHAVSPQRGCVLKGGVGYATTPCFGSRAAAVATVSDKEHRPGGYMEGMCHGLEAVCLSKAQNVRQGDVSES